MTQTAPAAFCRTQRPDVVWVGNKARSVKRCVMDHAQLENWVNEIVAAVKSGKSSEDDRLEMKTEWPTDFAKTSRQLAGHANAARGGQILWIIGLNQRAGTVTGADERE